MGNLDLKNWENSFFLSDNRKFIMKFYRLGYTCY